MFGLAHKNRTIDEQIEENATDKQRGTVTSSTLGSPSTNSNRAITAGRSPNDTINVTVLLHGQWILSGPHSSRKPIRQNREMRAYPRADSI